MINVYIPILYKLILFKRNDFLIFFSYDFIVNINNLLFKRCMQMYKQYNVVKKNHTSTMLNCFNTNKM